MQRIRSVLRRMTMAAFAFGLMFVIPNSAGAQTSQVQTDRLPWQTSAIFTATAPFDNDWTRVLSDTHLLLRKFATQYPFNDVLTVDSIARMDARMNARGPLWIPNVQTYLPSTQDPPRIDVGTIRATLTPVEFTSGVAAESRTMQGILAGVQFELVD